MSWRARMDRRLILLRSRMGRRLFLLFISCALLPVMLLAAISYHQVGGQLEEQCYDYMHQGAKNLGMFIFMRLVDLDDKLGVLADHLDRGASGGFGDDDDAFVRSFDRHFSGLAICGAQPRPVATRGRAFEPPALTPEHAEHLAAGKTVILTVRDDDGIGRLLLCRAIGADGPFPYLIGRVADDWLADPGGSAITVPLVDMQLNDETGVRLAANASEAIPFALPGGEDARRFEWRSRTGDAHLASRWTVFLASRFHAPAWILTLSRPRAEVMAPTREFRKLFPPVVLLAVWLILLLSHLQIRRTMRPLDELQAGTRRIAEGDFASRLAIASGDELEDLADAFNGMAGRLGRQFGILEGIADIDQAILATLNPEEIMTIVRDRFQLALGCERVATVLTLDDDAARTDLIANLLPIRGWEPGDGTCPVFPRHILLLPGMASPLFCSALARDPDSTCLILPLQLEERLAGAIALAYGDNIPRDEIDLARQLADQVTVALSNADLLNRLQRLNWGTLLALAGAVDAKSSWTAGHSERVTNLAIRIGGRAGLSDDELDLLQRGGLLHDIGKLGIPSEILDKPGKLTDEEFAKIKEHPSIGARILGPIPTYAEIIPMVEQHHEHFAGGGYPGNLSGDEIAFGARIIAVADVYDALVFDRPYRKGWSRARVRDFIVERSGTQFDPAVVAAFVEVMEEMDEQERADLPAANREATPANVERGT